MRRNVDALARTSGLVGTVLHAEPHPGVILTVAVRHDPSALRVETRSILVDGRFFALRMESGATYNGVAFADRDGNRRPDPGEPWGTSGAPVLAPAGVAVRLGEIALTQAAAMPGALSSAMEALPRRDAPLALGELTALDDERFTVEAGIKGLWAPAAIHCGDSCQEQEKIA